MWQAIALMIITEFSSVMTELQVQNKWKSLERSYKTTKTKNNSSGHSRALCEYEERVLLTIAYSLRLLYLQQIFFFFHRELSDVLEKEHHITPIVLEARSNN